MKKILTAIYTFNLTVYQKALLFVLAFSIPFLISGPQILTGSLVNALLFIFSAKIFTRKNFSLAFFVSLLPSLGALSHGVLFGKFTVYLVFFLPFIWFGNMTLIVIFSQTKNFIFPLNIFFPSLLKSALLYSSALFLTTYQVVPKAFLVPMGVIQLFTALIGGTIALLLFQIEKRRLWERFKS